MYYIKLVGEGDKHPHVQKIHEGQVVNYLCTLSLLIPASIRILSQAHRVGEAVSVDTDLEYKANAYGFVVPSKIINQVSKAIDAQDAHNHVNH